MGNDENFGDNELSAGTIQCHSNKKVGDYTEKQL